MRKVPAALVKGWEKLSSDSPLEALGSSHVLHRTIADWQKTLVREVLESGGSWEEVGVALGTTKQAAWARFRVAVGQGGGHEAVQDREQLKVNLKAIWDAGQARLREMDAAWRKEEQLLRDQVRDVTNRLNSEKRRHSRERREARNDLRRQMEAARK